MHGQKKTSKFSGRSAV